MLPSRQLTIPYSFGPPHRQRFAELDRERPTAQRTLYFSEVISDPSDPNSPTNFFITVDGHTPVLFSPDNPPAIVTTQGAVEDWTIENRSMENHEFHIHQIHFMLLEQNGVAVNNGQFLDMIQVPYWSGTGPYPSVKVRMDFRGPLVGDFVYHCHILGTRGQRHDGDHSRKATARAARPPLSHPPSSIMFDGRISEGETISIGDVVRGAGVRSGAGQH